MSKPLDPLRIYAKAALGTGIAGIAFVLIGTGIDSEAVTVWGICLMVAAPSFMYGMLITLNHTRKLRQK